MAHMCRHLHDSISSTPKNWTRMSSERITTIRLPSERYYRQNRPYSIWEVPSIPVKRHFEPFPSSTARQVPDGPDPVSRHLAVPCQSSIDALAIDHSAGYVHDLLRPTARARRAVPSRYYFDINMGGERNSFKLNVDNMFREDSPVLTSSASRKP